jgi:hypothetical protein
MPKIRDLGVKVIPETMRPLEMGDGGCTVSGCDASGCDCSSPSCGQCTNATCGQCTAMVTCHCSRAITLCACTTHISCAGHTLVACGGCTLILTCFCSRSIWCPGATNCGAISPVCTASIDPTIGPWQPISQEQIDILRTQLKAQLAALDEHERGIETHTRITLDAREKELHDELAKLRGAPKKKK